MWAYGIYSELQLRWRLQSLTAAAVHMLARCTESPNDDRPGTTTVDTQVQSILTGRFYLNDVAIFMQLPPCDQVQVCTLVASRAHTPPADTSPLLTEGWRSILHTVTRLAAVQSYRSRQLATKPAPSVMPLVGGLFTRFQMPAPVHAGESS